MKWAVLPVAGGLYDQSPQLLEEWELYFRVQGAMDKQRAEQEKRNAESKRPRS